MTKRGRPPADSPSPGPVAGPIAGSTTPADSGSAYAEALKVGFKATTTQVQRMHQAIAGKTFDALARVPGVALPANWVRGAHDMISGGVYAAIRGGGHAAFSLAGAAEQLLSDTERAPHGAELQLRSALNAVAGDALAASGSTLALRMTWFGGLQTLAPLSPASMAGLGERVCVFIHGLACNEQNWLTGDAWDTSPAPPGQTPNYGALLAQELGISPVYLRYNSGLAITENGRRLAEQLEALASAAPQVQQWVLIGHSMGGLVARHACDHADAVGLAWRQRCSVLICLGTPHQGAPLEQLGHVVAGGLRLSDVTRPLTHIADTRSRGVKDLRKGRGVQRDDASAPQRSSPALALRFVAGSLGDAEGKLMDRVVDRMLGDGLVTPGSASDVGLEGDIQCVNIQRANVPGLGHMALLNHPRVYALIKGWLAA